MGHPHGGPFAQTTGRDHVPLDGFNGTATGAGGAADGSADVHVNGSNAIAGNSAAEAAEIAAVPNPQSPEGQRQILAIIEKYQSKSAGTVEESAATQQANGEDAANGGHHHHGDEDDKDDSKGGSGLMDILSQLLGSGGSGLQGMNPLA